MVGGIGTRLGTREKGSQNNVEIAAPVLRVRVALPVPLLLPREHAALQQLGVDHRHVRDVALGDLGLHRGREAHVRRHVRKAAKQRNIFYMRNQLHTGGPKRGTDQHDIVDIVAQNR